MEGSIGSHLGTSRTQDFVLLAALGVGLYVIYNIIQGVKSTVAGVGAAASAVGQAASTAYTTTTDAVGSGLYTLFGPADIGTDTYYTVTFPNGARHAVPSNTVDASGNFTWTGYPAGSSPPIALTLVKDQNHNWFATSNTFMPLEPGQLQPVVVDPSIVSYVPPINYGPGQGSIS